MERDGRKTTAVAGGAADGRNGRDGTRPKKMPYSRSVPALPQQLNAVMPKPQPKQKHQVYFELIEVDNTKKKLEFEVQRRSRRQRSWR
jgi:hypothetical protein